MQHGLLMLLALLMLLYANGMHDTVDTVGLSDAVGVAGCYECYCYN